jgi:hypothetical protein
MDQVMKTKKGKGGRPVKMVKKNIRSGVRFSQTEYFIAKEKAAKAGMRYTEYIRHMAIHGQVIARLNNEERGNVRQLSGMANNFNQMVKIAYKEGMLSAMLLFENYRNQLDEIIKTLRHDQ